MTLLVLGLAVMGAAQELLASPLVNFAALIFTATATLWQTSWASSCLFRGKNSRSKTAQGWQPHFHLLPFLPHCVFPLLFTKTILWGRFFSSSSSSSSCMKLLLKELASSEDAFMELKGHRDLTHCCVFEEGFISSPFKPADTLMLFTLKDVNGRVYVFSTGPCRCCSMRMYSVYWTFSLVVWFQSTKTKRIISKSIGGLLLLSICLTFGSVRGRQPTVIY